MSTQRDEMAVSVHPCGRRRNPAVLPQSGDVQSDFDGQGMVMTIESSSACQEWSMVNVDGLITSGVLQPARRMV
jgi:hypothetical protein